MPGPAERGRNCRVCGYYESTLSMRLGAFDTLLVRFERSFPLPFAAVDAPAVFVRC